MSDADLMLAPRGSALDGDAVLDRMMARLEAIIGEPQLTAEGLVEITAAVCALWLLSACGGVLQRLVYEGV
jgi:hypothetical protein